MILILSGSEIEKINLSRQKNIFKKINLYGIVAEENFYLKRLILTINKKLLLQILLV